MTLSRYVAPLCWGFYTRYTLFSVVSLCTPGEPLLMLLLAGWLNRQPTDHCLSFFHLSLRTTTTFFSSPSLTQSLCKGNHGDIGERISLGSMNERISQSVAIRKSFVGIQSTLIGSAIIQGVF